MLPPTHESVLEYIKDKSNGPRHAILIDPANQEPSTSVERVEAALKGGSSLILVGGSTETDHDVVHRTVDAIQSMLETNSMDEPDGGWEIPVVLFPSGANALSYSADAITFMMLMNSQSQRFLIGEQVNAANFIHELGCQPLPTGYLVFSPGGRVGEVGQANLIGSGDDELVQAYSRTAEWYGFEILYLEAGSGATKPVSPNLVAIARKSTDLTLFVGGGLRDAQSIRDAVNAGADWVVTGNVIEEVHNPEDITELVKNLLK